MLSFKQKAMYSCEDELGLVVVSIEYFGKYCIIVKDREY